MRGRCSRSFRPKAGTTRKPSCRRRGRTPRSSPAGLAACSDRGARARRGRRGARSDSLAAAAELTAAAGRCAPALRRPRRPGTAADAVRRARGGRRRRPAALGRPRGVRFRIRCSRRRCWPGWARAGARERTAPRRSSPATRRPRSGTARRPPRRPDAALAADFEAFAGRAAARAAGGGDGADHRQPAERRRATQRDARLLRAVDWMLLAGDLALARTLRRRGRGHGAAARGATRPLRGLRPDLRRRRGRRAAAGRRRGAAATRAPIPELAALIAHRNAFHALVNLRDDEVVEWTARARWALARTRCSASSGSRCTRWLCGGSAGAARPTPLLEAASGARRRRRRAAARQARLAALRRRRPRPRPRGPGGRRRGRAAPRRLEHRRRPPDVARPRALRRGRLGGRGRRPPSARSRSPPSSSTRPARAFVWWAAVARARRARRLGGGRRLRRRGRRRADRRARPRRRRRAWPRRSSGRGTRRRRGGDRARWRRSRARSSRAAGVDAPGFWPWQHLYADALVARRARSTTPTPSSRRHEPLAADRGHASMSARLARRARAPRGRARRPRGRRDARLRARARADRAARDAVRACADRARARPVPAPRRPAPRRRAAAHRGARHVRRARRAPRARARRARARRLRACSRCGAARASSPS